MVAEGGIVLNSNSTWNTRQAISVRKGGSLVTAPPGTLKAAPAMVETAARSHSRLPLTFLPTRGGRLCACLTTGALCPSGRGRVGGALGSAHLTPDIETTGSGANRNVKMSRQPGCSPASKTFGLFQTWRITVCAQSKRGDWRMQWLLPTFPSHL